MPAKGQINPAIRDEAGNIISWKKRNRAASNASTRARRANDVVKARKDNRRWRENNPFGTAACVAHSRAKQLGIVSTLTKEEWRGVVYSADFRCHICGDKIILEIGNPDRLSLDHVIPLSCGGTNVKDNVAPAHNRCNKARSNMTLAEFDLWLDKVYLSRRSGHGKSEKS